MSDGDEKHKYDESLAGLRDSWLALFGVGGISGSPGPPSHTLPSHTLPSHTSPSHTSHGLDWLSPALLQEQMKAMQNMMGFALAFAQPVREFVESQHDLAEKMTEWAKSQAALAEVAAEWAESQRKLSEMLMSWAAVQSFANGIGHTPA